jgi:uncharacterized paraquat-inducible protein A
MPAMDTLNKPLFAGFTLLHALLAVFLVLVLAPLVSKFMQSRSDPPMAKHRAMTSCPACGWTGNVSKHVPRCPKCSAPLVT